MAGDKTLTFTDASFDADVLKSEVPVLVDFWAMWCGPCRMMSATIDQVATEYSGKVKVGKLDVDTNQATAMRYGIRGIPTLLLFKGGKVVDQKVGAIGKPEFMKMLDAQVSAVSSQPPAASPQPPAVPPPTVSSQPAAIPEQVKS
jgi:thioredoxin 1